MLALVLAPGRRGSDHGSDLVRPSGVIITPGPVDRGSESVSARAAGDPYHALFYYRY